MLKSLLSCHGNLDLTSMGVLCLILYPLLNSLFVLCVYVNLSSKLLRKNIVFQETAALSGFTSGIIESLRTVPRNTNSDLLFFDNYLIYLA